MQYQPSLHIGVFIRRYKRFLTDVLVISEESLARFTKDQAYHMAQTILAGKPVENARVITIFCPNTGSMKNCASTGDLIWFSHSDNPKRKYAHTWELTQTWDQSWIGINTHYANKLVAEFFGRRESFLKQEFNQVIAEPSCKKLLQICKSAHPKSYENLEQSLVWQQNNKSRFDFALLAENTKVVPVVVEVKSVTLLESGWGFFPDAVSTRGQKHLDLLIEARRAGLAAVLLFCVQHTGIERVQAADHIDPAYAAKLAQAIQAGVQVVALKARISSTAIELQDYQLPVFGTA